MNQGIVFFLLRQLKGMLDKSVRQLAEEVITLLFTMALLIALVCSWVYNMSGVVAAEAAYLCAFLTYKTNNILFYTFFRLPVCC